MIEYLFVTTFSQKGYEEYGRRFLTGFKNHFPKECILACFYEGDKPEVDAPNIWYFDLSADKDHQAFKERHKNNPNANGYFKTPDGKTIVDYRWQAVRFSHKVAALTSPDLPSSEWRIWLDADVIVEKSIPLSFLQGLLSDGSIVAQYIGRPKEVWHTSECGWVAYNTRGEDAKQFLTDFRNCYMDDDVFTLGETHDSFVFDRIREHYEQQGCKFQDIAAGLHEFHPWPKTALGQYMTHLKGPVAKQENSASKNIDISVDSLKLTGGNKKQTSTPKTNFKAEATTKLDIVKIANGCKSRYHQITNLLSIVKPKVIVEVGVFNGNRAIEMAGVMVSQGLPVHYLGFDVFEDATKELNEKELNGKGPCSYEEVVKKLSEYEQKSNGLFTFELFKGLTSDTLWNMNLGAVDFAFIDGGHSVETIRGDYQALSEAKVLLFDDFYLKGIDTTKFGCNEIVKDIPHTLLPVVDTFKEMQIALVLSGKDVAVDKPITAQDAKTMQLQQDEGIKIKTRNCVEDTVIHNNIRYSARYAKQAKVKDIANVDFAPPMLSPTDHTYVLVGGGDSVLDKKNTQYVKNWEAIKNYHRMGARIVGVKTSYDALRAKGIIPWGCLLLDPRPHVAESIKDPHNDTIYFIASMCDKTVWDKFAGGGYKCIGYHAGVLVKEDKIVEELYDGCVMIQGGTTSGFRGISLLYTLGARNFVLVGFDSSYEGKPEKVHGKSPKPALQVHVHGRDFWTDPELIAQSQDMEMLTKHLPSANVKYVGNGMLQHAHSVLEDMLTKQAGSREKAPFLLYGYVNAIQQKNDLAEALTIDSAITFLLERKQAIDDAIKQRGTLDDFISKQVNTPSRTSTQGLTNGL